MKITGKLLLTGAAAFILLFAGCTGGYYAGGPYEGPYYGDFGPYAPGYGPFYGGDLVIGSSHYENHSGDHHFYGRSFENRHFAVAQKPGGYHGGAHVSNPAPHPMHTQQHH